MRRAVAQAISMLRLMNPRKQALRHIAISFPGNRDYGTKAADVLPMAVAEAEREPVDVVAPDDHNRPHVARRVHTERLATGAVSGTRLQHVARARGARRETPASRST